MKFSHIICLSLPLLAASCSDPSFSIKGEIEGGEGKTVVLEKADNSGRWVAIDSTSLKAGGKFSFSPHAPMAPDIYRLDLEGRYVYFPVDSIDKLTLTASAANFSHDFTLSGSENAETLARFEKELLTSTAKLSVADSAKAFKRHIFTEYLLNARGSVVSYYILTKTVDGRPLFTPAEDAPYFAAVATSFREFRPNDPRCALLENTATEGMRRRAGQRGQRHVMEADEIGFFPISLPDESGKNVALSDIAGHGVPTLLVFSDFSDPEAMALNSRLKKLYESGKVKIYQVGVDADRLTWRNAASNLPWTTVFATVSEVNDICAKYMVTSLPTVFVIDARGDISARPGNLDEINSLL
ncbi:MAG: DUF4369 domain-containing protein [Muribaculaceae bacterium]|nr:DUF4369 domain-containing protein [Muribaculaceae bacterium]